MNSLVPYREEEILPLSIYERLELNKKLRQEQESMFMSKLVTFIVALNALGIFFCMALILIKLLQ